MSASRQLRTWAARGLCPGSAACPAEFGLASHCNCPSLILKINLPHYTHIQLVLFPGKPWLMNKFNSIKKHLLTTYPPTQRATGLQASPQPGRTGAHKACRPVQWVLSRRELGAQPRQHWFEGRRDLGWDHWSRVLRW